MGKFVLAIGVLAMYVYVIIELVRSPRVEVRVLPKWLWAVIVLLIPLFGPVLWLVLGRPRTGYAPGSGDAGPFGGLGPRPRGPVAPDDDPNFLKRLDDQSWAARMEHLRREREAGAADHSDPGVGPGSTPDAGPAADPTPEQDSGQPRG